MQRRDANTETAYIYRLPTELLSLIFTFLFLFKNAVAPVRPNPNTTVYIKPQLVVRWVSVWFRKVGSRHMFWHDNDLDVIQFLSNDDIQDLVNGEPPPFKLPNGYLEILLNDDDLRYSLQHRSGWKFHNPIDLVRLSQKEPYFFRNTQSLFFNYYIDDMPLNVLDLFVSLTSLFIGVMEPPLDLDAIVKFCPLLKSLEIERLDEFDGSLAPLQNITYLSIAMDSQCESPFSSLIPFNSGNILTHLILYIPNDSSVSFESLTSNPFDALVNLTDLELLNFNPGLFELVANTRITSIVNLKVTIFVCEEDAEIAESAHLRMFSAASLKGLRSLTIEGDEFGDYDDLEPTPYDLVDMNILAGFHYLEYLDLDFAFPRDWWSGFGNMRNLEVLRVWIDLEEYGMAKVDYDEIIATGKGLCASIFANRHRKIRVVAREWGTRPPVTIFDDWFGGGEVLR